MNSGLSSLRDPADSNVVKQRGETLKINFPTILPEPRPIVSYQVIPDPNWFTGFVDGEGCFYVKLTKSKAYLSGFQVGVYFSVYQHARDEYLLTSFIEYLGCGKIEIPSTRSRLRRSQPPQVAPGSEQVKFVVYKFSDIFEKIIPFFQRHNLQGIKYMDYKDFCQVANIVKDKSHLTPSLRDPFLSLSLRSRRNRKAGKGLE
uniref:LAGLIDADG endonuclease n=1 Tax=Juglanconis sp. TaxID=2041886 RepID=A0A291LIH7_9PEZI|nr:LAGLIDADG endonuclease [Juglanconis sp.]